MNSSVRLSEPVWLEEPWRLTWLIPVALVLWAGLLFTFSLLLKQTAPPPSADIMVEARIVELPPTAGLQSSSAPARAPIPAVRPKPRVRPAPRRVEPRPAKPEPASAPLPPPSGSGTAKSVATPIPAAASSGKTGPEENQDNEGGLQGTDNAGARATYAPVPEIPDDLRENIINTVAVAHFKVDTNGMPVVSLAQPTDNPELNAILLDTLKQWRFAPATRGGIAVESEFDLRIPITVQ